MAETLRRLEKLKVFISYSRQDIAFVDRLQAALEARDIEAAVDRNDIEKGEAWWKRLQQLITEADTVVFVLSPSSVDSQVCQDEVDFAERLRKQFIPIVAKDIAGRKVPDALARLNYIFFIPQATADATGNFEEALDHLHNALLTDIDWIREHTRVGTLAQRWLAQEQGSDLLLRGNELAAPERWITTRPVKAPDPSDAHLKYIAASRLAADRRQRQWTWGISTVALFTLTLAVFAFNEMLDANKQRDQALSAEASSAAEIADRYIKSADATTGGLLALEVLPSKANGKRPYVAAAERALYSAIFKGHEIETATPPGYPPLFGETSPVRDRARADGDPAKCRIVSSPQGIYYAKVCEIRDVIEIYLKKTKKLIQTLNAKTETIDAHFSDDDEWIVTTAGWYQTQGTTGDEEAPDFTTRLWEAKSGKLLKKFEGHNDTVVGAVIDRTKKKLASASYDGSIIIWDIETGKQIAKIAPELWGLNYPHSANIQKIMPAPSGSGFATLDFDGKTTWSFFPGWKRLPAARKGTEVHLTQVADCLGEAESQSYAIGETGRNEVMLPGAGQYQFRWNEFVPQNNNGNGYYDTEHVNVYDTDTKKFLHSSDGHKWRVYCGFVLVNRSEIFTFSGENTGKTHSSRSDDTIRVFDLATGMSKAVLRGHRAPPVGLFLVDGGDRILTVDESDYWILWYGQTWEKLAEFDSALDLGDASGNELGADMKESSEDLVRAFKERLAQVAGEANSHIFSSLDDLMYFAKTNLPRCLTLAQRTRFGLSSVPPRWCITGAGLEGEKDPLKWQPKWPYQSSAWTNWLSASDRGETPPLPKSDE